jgi:penicillin-binding protein 1B
VRKVELSVKVFLMNKWKSIFTFLIVVLGVMFFGAFFFSLYVIHQSPLDRLDSVLPSGEAKHEEDQSELEDGSSVLLKDFEAFYLFSLSKTPFSEYFDLLKRSNYIEHRGKEIVFLKNTKLPPLRKNDCSQIYCLQNRVPFKSIPSPFWRGLIGIEDKRFLQHKGVDPYSILRAAIHDIIHMRFEQGGSTLTQQLVKNLYYTNERKLIRKVKEVILSLYIEFNYEKEQILEAYFNEITWGAVQGMRIKGIASASKAYFQKKLSHITEYEAAILISMLKGPSFYNPLRHEERLRKRVDIVFSKLIELGLYSKRMKRWDDKTWGNWIKRLKDFNEGKQLFSIWLVDSKIKTEAGPNSQQLWSFYEKYFFIIRARNVLGKIKKKHPNEDFAIKAIFGDVSSDKINFSFYSKVERKEQKALDAEFHQTGSTLKPLLYGMLIQSKEELEEEVETGELVLKLKSGSWSPSEAHKNLPKKIKYREALQISLNRPLIRKAQEFGWEELEELLITDFVRLKRPLAEYPAQLLGSMELSLSEFFKIYKKFLIRACNDKGVGHILESLSDPNKTTIRNLVGKELGQLLFFGKTGTTNYGHDNWFISFDGKELGLIWVGNEAPRGEKDLQLYGGSTAFKLFRDFTKFRGKRFNDMACPSFVK